MPNEIETHTANLLVTDLDNTLWDWFAAWFSQFDALLTGIVEKSGIPRTQLEAEARVLHQKYQTTEYSWLINEMPSLKDFANPEEIGEVFKEAVHDQNSARKNSTILYPGVKETLQHLRDINVPVVAYTEAQLYWTEWRIRLLGLDGLINCLYSPPDHDHPAGITPEKMRTLDASNYGLKKTEHRAVSRGITKPNPTVLHEIISWYGVPADSVVYVGDSKIKDVSMAQNVGALGVWAKYGQVHEKSQYELLRRVSHWTGQAIEEEKQSDLAPTPQPTYTIENDYGELLELFRFEALRS